jgi:hypothetical protein
MVEFNCFLVFSFPETWNVIRALYYVRRGVQITRVDEIYYHREHDLDHRLQTWKQGGYRVTGYPIRQSESVYVIQSQPAETEPAKVFIAIIDAIGWQAPALTTPAQTELPSSDGKPGETSPHLDLLGETQAMIEQKEAQIQWQQAQIDNLERKIDHLTALVERLTQEPVSLPTPKPRGASSPTRHEDLLDSLHITQAEETDDRSAQNFIQSLFNIQNVFRTQKPADTRHPRASYQEPELEIRLVSEEDQSGNPKAMDVPQFDAPDFDDLEDIEF